jgi:hypothetical protein
VILELQVQTAQLVLKAQLDHKDLQVILELQVQKALLVLLPVLEPLCLQAIKWMVKATALL